MLMLPEITLLVAALVVFFLNFSEAKYRFLIPGITLLGIGFSLVGLVMLPHLGVHFEGRFVIDPVAWWFKIVFLISGLMVTGISYDLLAGSFKELKSSAEFCILLLFLLCGMLFLVSSQDIITFYVSLELATIPLYALSCWKKTQHASREASLKYFILGILASSSLLYGFSLLYGMTGETSFDAIRNALEFSPTLILATALIGGPIAFKFTLVPFHQWAPDVYQGAPSSVTAFLASASKVTGVVLLFHLYFRLLAPHLPMTEELIAIAAALTMTLGNLVAIVQNEIKRFMAFSGISQAGYLLLGFLGQSHDGQNAILYYLLVYIISNLVVFGIIIFQERASHRLRISEYNGFSQTHPLLALMMMLALFSLAGIPPLAGFVGKFFLFSVAAASGLYWLVFLAAINSTVSLYYYLRVVRAMYIDSAAAPAGAAGETSPTPLHYVSKITLALGTLAMIALGIFPFVYENLVRLID